MQSYHLKIRAASGVGSSDAGHGAGRCQGSVSTPGLCCSWDWTTGTGESAVWSEHRPCAEPTPGQVCHPLHDGLKSGPLTLTKSEGSYPQASTPSLCSAIQAVATACAKALRWALILLL